MPPLTARGAVPSAAIKAQYQKALIKMADEMRDSVTYWLTARYGAREDEIVAADASPTANLLKELRALLRQWGKRFNEFAATRALWFAKSTNRSVTTQLVSSLKDAGLTVKFANSRRVNSILRAIVAENVGLIKSIPQQYLSEVEGIVLRGVQNGRDMGFITEELQGRYKVTRNRAITIARDQTNKATEAISSQRCQSIGVTHGFWMHRSGSKKPRSTHEAMNGTRFELAAGLYDSAVGYEVKPGELINCHCTFKLDISTVAPGVAMDGSLVRWGVAA